MRYKKLGPFTGEICWREWGIQLTFGALDRHYQFHFQLGPFKLYWYKEYANE